MSWVAAFVLLWTLIAGYLGANTYALATYSSAPHPVIHYQMLPKAPIPIAPHR